MKWSPPRIECRFRLVSVRASFRHAIVASFLTSFFLSGCASIPAMTSAAPGLIAKSDKADAFTAEEQARVSAMPAIPEFDIEAPQVAEAQQIAVATTSPAPVSPAPAAAVPAITEVAKDGAPVVASVAAATESVASVANTAMASADGRVQTITTSPPTFQNLLIRLRRSRRSIQSRKLLQLRRLRWLLQNLPA